MILQSFKGHHELIFDEDKHKYWLDKEPCPGVTTVNKQGYPKSEALLKWQIKQGIEEYETQKKAKQAATIGSIVHDYCYCVETKTPFDRSRIDLHADRSKIEECISHFESWRLKNKDQMISSEEIIASIKYKYCGKFDRLASRGTDVILSDFKTSSGIYIDQFMQLAGYAIALEEWKGIEVDAYEVLRFGKNDASFETKLIDNKKVIKELKNQFIRNVKTFYFRKEYDSGKPNF